MIRCRSPILRWPNQATTARFSGKAVRLAVEISDSTLAIDMGRKAHLYARHAVPEYWVVDVEAGSIHQMWNPADASYREKRTIALGESIEAATIVGLRVATSRS